MNNHSDFPELIRQARRRYPELTEKMTDEEVDMLIDDMIDDYAGDPEPFFARALDKGNLPLWAVGIVAALSIVGMLIAAVVGP